MKTTITILIWLIPVFVHAQSTSLPKCADPLGRAGVVYDPKKFACHEGRRYPIEFATLYQRRREKLDAIRPDARPM